MLNKNFKFIFFVLFSIKAFCGTGDPWLDLAIEEIKSNYGDTVSIIDKRKSLLKFGTTNNADTDMTTTVMTLPSSIVHESYLSTNTIAYVSSASNFDSGINVTYEGHYYNSTTGNFTFKIQTVTLAGNTKTALPTPLARVTRAYNTSSTNILGAVYFYEDDTVVSGVPQTDAKVHLIIPAKLNQSEKAAMAVSYLDYYIITQVYYGGGRGNTNIKLDFALEVRSFNRVFLPLFKTSLTSNEGSKIIDFKPYKIVPKNSDVRMVVTSSADNATASAWFNGILASITR